jgi:hypothetical protein
MAFSPQRFEPGTLINTFLELYHYINQLGAKSKSAFGHLKAM